MMNKIDPKKTPSPSPSESVGDNATIQVGRISYLNVDPIYYGLENGLKPPWVELTAAPPASLNCLMVEGKLDISPVSTGAYTRHTDQWLILPNLSISCHGSVMSVLLASNFPLDDLDGRRVVVTSESGTAVLLLKLIFAMKGIKPHIQSGPVGDRWKSTDQPDAVMIIGDIALSGRWEQKYTYLMDLGDMWLQLSGLPIVFAVWVVQKSFAGRHPARVTEMIDLFRRSAQVGQENMDRIIAHGTDRLNLDKNRLRAYFNAMQYDLDEKKRQALMAFFDGLHEHGLIERSTRLSFFMPIEGEQKSTPFG